MLLLQNTTGLSLPDWNLPSDLEKMQELADFTLTQMFNSREKNRLTAGESHTIVVYKPINWEEPFGNR